MQVNSINPAFGKKSVKNPNKTSHPSKTGAKIGAAIYGALSVGAGALFAADAGKSNRLLGFVDGITIGPWALLPEKISRVHNNLHHNIFDNIFKFRDKFSKSNIINNKLFNSSYKMAEIVLSLSAIAVTVGIGAGIGAIVKAVKNHKAAKAE